MPDARPDTVFVCRTSGWAPEASETFPPTSPALPSVLPCASSDLDRLGHQHPRAEFLLLLDHPADVVSRQAAAGADASAALRDWSKSAAFMQRHLRRRRRQTLVLSVEELIAHGPSSAGSLPASRPWLTSTLAAVADQEHRAPSSADPLVLMLARRAVERDSLVSGLHGELLASCEPMDDARQMPSAAHPLGADDTTAEWHLKAIDTLRGSREELAHLRTRTQSLQSRLDESAASARAHDNALENSRILRERLEAELARAEADSAALLTQLHATQEELEQLFLGQRATSAEQLVARTALELESDRLQAAQKAQAETQQRLAIAERELDALRQRQAKFELDKNAMSEREAQLAAEGQRLQLQLNKSQEEVESRGMELHRARSAAEQAQAGAQQALTRCRGERQAAQEEALGHFLRLKAYEDSGPGTFMTLTPGAEGSTVDLGRIAIGAAHDAGEHRHIDFELVQARTPRGAHAPVRLRLLEHAGRPGLAILHTAGEPEVLGAWQTHGHEGDTRFCLLIPGDTRSQTLWLRLGGADWRFLVALVVQLEATLANVDLPSALFWRGVARRLRMQLWQLPPRLRYDGVEVFGDASGDGTAAVRIEFHNVIYGMRELGRMTLIWRPGAGYSNDPSSAAVSCLYEGNTDMGSPPLASWPVAAEGKWVSAVSLPVGPGMPSSLRRRLWAALPLGDRQFVLALLDAMPAADEHLDGAPPTVPPQTATVARAARDLHKQARRTMLNLELRRNLRSLLRR